MKEYYNVIKKQQDFQTCTLLPYQHLAVLYRCLRASAELLRHAPSRSQPSLALGCLAGPMLGLRPGRP